MARTLRLADDLELPLDVATEALAIIARRGAGKTYTAQKLAEELVGAGIPTVALDPKGDWWGLRSSADGKSEGLPVTILGGPHGDIAIEPSGGREVAEFVAVDQPGAYVIDLSGFPLLSEQDQFAHDFAARLYRAKAKHQEPLHLIVDEAHNFIPQNVASGRGSGGIGPKLLGAFETLVRQGRGYGLGCTLVTQRPAVVNKNVLSQVEVLVAMQITSKADRDAVRDWAVPFADKATVDQFLASLAALKPGYGWIWSPAFLDIFQPIHVAQRWTFDSSATPKVGERRIEPRVLAAVDLDMLKQRMAATIERAEANDPKLLQQRIRSIERERDALGRELATAREARPTSIEYVETPVVPEALVEAIVAVGATLGELSYHLGDPLAQLHTRAMSALTDLNEASRQALAAANDTATSARRSTTPAPAPRAHGQRPVSTQAQEPVAAMVGSSTAKLSTGERQILAALATYGERTPRQVAALTGRAAKGGGFANLISGLRTTGRIEGSRSLVITEQGRADLGHYEPLPSGPALLEHWMAHQRVGAAGREILRVLVEAWPDTLTPIECAARTLKADGSGPYEAKGGGFANAASALRSLGVIVGWRAADELMEAIQ